VSVPVGRIYWGRYCEVLTAVNIKITYRTWRSSVCALRAVGVFHLQVCYLFRLLFSDVTAIYGSSPEQRSSQISHLMYCRPNQQWQFWRETYFILVMLYSSLPPSPLFIHYQSPSNSHFNFKLLLFILIANGFSPGGSGTTIRHNTQTRHNTQNNTTIKRNIVHKNTHTINTLHRMKIHKHNYNYINYYYITNHAITTQ
jgi:hypothetical protein